MRAGARYFTCPKCPDRLWRAPSHLFGGQPGYRIKRPGVELTVRLHLVCRLTLPGSVPRPPRAHGRLHLTEPDIFCEHFVSQTAVAYAVPAAHVTTVRTELCDLFRVLVGK
jgi:hypothetical protein